jgi:hypothetical protein
MQVTARAEATIAPKRQLGSLRAKRICSMKLPRSSAGGLPTPLRSAPVLGWNTKTLPLPRVGGSLSRLFAFLFLR